MKKNEMEVSTVGGRIKYLRKQLGMGQKDMRKIVPMPFAIIEPE